MTDLEVEAAGHAELRRLGSTLTADRLKYWQAEEIAEASGDVRLTQNQDVITGPKVRMNLAENVGFFERPQYSITRQPATATTAAPVTGYGSAERIEFLGENQYHLIRATYSTCGPDQPDWYAESADLRLDFDREEGVARDGKLVLIGVPLLYAPWLDFSLNNRRKSGFLPPTIGNSTKTGLSVTAPYYWNIAPNRDATIAPRIMTRRGVLLGGEFRYLDRDYSGVTQAEWMPNDRLADARRSFYSIQHQHALPYGISGSASVSGVSDATYFTDLSSRIASTSQRNLLRQGSLSYSGGWWNSALHVQRYQTLQDPSLPPVAVPYDRLPWMVVNASLPDVRRVDVTFNGELVHFRHPSQVEGTRLVLLPQLALPLLTPATYLIPRIGLHSSRYDLNRQPSDTPDRISRDLPILSIDSGVVFEREIEWTGRLWTQTIEPRLFYLYVPYRDQSQVPVFDTGVADFNFAQIFSDNTFVGNDRVADANQVTVGAVSRLIDPDSGVELIRAALAQRHYFRDQLVTMPGAAPRTRDSSDILAALSGLVVAGLRTEAAWQYNPSSRQSERVTLGVRYQPAAGRLVNGAYRFQSNVIKEFDISGQWPLFGRWAGAGRYNYSLRDKRLVEAVGGLEYDGGCWIARAVLHRFATSAQEANTAFFFQLEFNGLSRIGSNPVEILRRNIPGYGRINQSVADPVFGMQ